MDAKEAATIGRIVGTADGGCSTCVQGLADELVAAFPEHDWPALVTSDPDTAAEIRAYIADEVTLRG